MDALYELEFAILNFIQNNLTNPILDAFFRVYTHLGSGGIFCIIVACILLCIPKTRKIGVCLGFALAIGTLITNGIIKPLIDRDRPYEMVQALRNIGGTDGKLPLLVKAENDASFPSGHTTACIETAFGIFLYNKKWGSFAIGAALLVAYSRLYLYVHFLTDVLGGMVVGISAAIIAYYINKVLWPLYPKYLKEMPFPQVVVQFFKSGFREMKEDEKK